MKRKNKQGQDITKSQDGNNVMKIKSIDDSAITFDNDMDITFDHVADCCEYNYAAFEEIDDLAKNFEFSEI